MQTAQHFGLEIGEVVTDSQIRHLYNLMKQFTPPPPENVEDFLVEIKQAQANNQHIYYVEIDGLMVGAIKVFFYTSPLLGKMAYLGGLIIDENYRHSNVLYELLTAVEKRLLAAKVKCTRFGRAVREGDRECFAEKYGYERKINSYYCRRPPNFEPLPIDTDMQPQEVTTAEEFRSLIPLLQQAAPRLQDTPAAVVDFQEARAQGYVLYAIEYKGEMVGAIGVHVLFDANWGHASVMRDCCVADHPEKERITRNLFYFYRNFSNAGETISEEIALPVKGSVTGLPTLEGLAKEAGYEPTFIYFMRDYTAD